MIANRLNILMIFILSGVLLAGFWHQIFEGETPCVLCFLQRAGMTGIAVGALLNLKFGIRASHYAVCLLSALAGSSVAIRQILLHICPTFDTYGKPVLGFSLYVWSFIVFCSAILGICLLLFLYKEEPPKERLNKLENTAFALVFAITASNAISSFVNCGFGFCGN